MKPGKADIRSMGHDAIPGVVKSMGRIAIDAKAKRTNRLKAIEILLRVADGDHPAGVEARKALTRVGPFLEDVIKSEDGKRNNLKAVKLAERIADLG
jgi:hypothetical protein